MSTIKLIALTQETFSDYESLTCKEANGKSGCYCAFWHQKFNSMEAWEKRQKEEPLKNREVVRSRMISGFHVGVLAYQNDKLIGWISVGPLSEFNWTMKRALSVGSDAQTIAGIHCFSLAPDYRGKGYQTEILKELAAYGKTMGWSALEAYPFDHEAREKHGDKVAWPGFPEAFLAAGFVFSEKHWLNQVDYPRSIFRLQY